MNTTMTVPEQRTAAKRFVERWRVAEGNEDREARSFWIELLHDVLGIASPTRMLDFERRVKGRKIDVFCEDMGVLVEAKSRGVRLDRQYQRGTGEGGTKRMVTPYEQAKWYADNLPGDVRPRWIVICNFDEFRFHDLYKENPESDYTSMSLIELPDQLRLLSVFTDRENSTLERERQLSYEAGVLIGRIYDELQGRYAEPEDPYTLHSLSVLCVRLVFCLYAEDSGLFGRKSLFYDFLKDYDAAHLRAALRDLFRLLDTPEAERDPDEDPKLLAFPYVNGGLFEEDIRIPQMDESLRVDILLEASRKLDWSKLSPTIFGAMFESSISAKVRHENGMHYTSVENIHKSIDPLFLEELTDELRAAEAMRTGSERLKALHALQDRLASLTFLDPAMGSGNFLTESYLSLRKMENRILADIAGDGDQTMLAFDGEHAAIKVSIGQFYGIEIEDFAARVARTALWIAESQMHDRTREILPDLDYSVLPLRSYDNLRCANALKLDWNEVVPASELSYIIGNPPFLGARTMGSEQKEELKAVASGLSDSHDLDYVCGWYLKAAEMIDANPSIRAALVSTNSVCQGSQAASLWGWLAHKHGIAIEFAWKSFVWENEANDQAHVHCVIAGFGKNQQGKRAIYERNGEPVEAKNVNAYLVDAPNVFVASRRKPLCDVPEMANGNQPRDGGNLVLTSEERERALACEPGLERFVRPYIGSEEFIKGKRRYCLWLEGATSEDIAASPLLSARVKAVYDFRRASKAKTTNGYARTPALFAQRPQKQGADFLLLPMTSSERRDYLPIGYMDKSVVASNAAFVIPDATLYHFGVLTSRMHNVWMRVTAGRLKSDFRYSKEIVYNCFPWPEPDDARRAEVERRAQAVLDARAAHPGVPPKDLYDPEKAFLYLDLIEAHERLDRAVEAAYGADFGGDEAKMVAHLFELYAAMTEGEDDGR